MVEIGMGTDLHGGDVTKAAQKAVKDAISRSCLCGLAEILNIDPGKMHTEIKLGCPHPEKVDRKAVLGLLPFGTAALEAVSGGLTVTGLALPPLGEGSDIVVVIAALTVYVDYEG